MRNLLKNVSRRAKEKADEEEDEAYLDMNERPFYDFDQVDKDE
jgi:hypothetical protein